MDISQQSCHLLSKEMEAQRGWVLGPRAQSYEVVEMRSAFLEVQASITPSPCLPEKEEVKALSIRDRFLEVQGFQRLGDG